MSIEKLQMLQKKIDDEAPHQVILVLEATSGQKVIKQVDHFEFVYWRVSEEIYGRL